MILKKGPRVCSLRSRFWAFDAANISVMVGIGIFFMVLALSPYRMLLFLRELKRVLAGVIWSGDDKQESGVIK